MWERQPNALSHIAIVTNFVKGYHIADASKMIPMDIKKAQFRIEHLSGYSSVLITTIVWHYKSRNNNRKSKGFGAEILIFVEK